MLNDGSDSVNYSVSNLSRCVSWLITPFDTLRALSAAVLVWNAVKTAEIWWVLCPVAGRSDVESGRSDVESGPLSSKSADWWDPDCSVGRARRSALAWSRELLGSSDWWRELPGNSDWWRELPGSSDWWRGPAGTCRSLALTNCCLWRPGRYSGAKRGSVSADDAVCGDRVATVEPSGAPSARTALMNDQGLYRRENSP